MRVLSALNKYSLQHNLSAYTPSGDLIITTGPASHIGILKHILTIPKILSFASLSYQIISSCLSKPTFSSHKILYSLTQNTLTNLLYLIDTRLITSNYSFIHLASLLTAMFYFTYNIKPVFYENVRT